MNQPEFTLFSSDADAAGFRLDRFEVFNWGAFHEKVYELPLAGENALLTGANGAGKTTLVDALITLLNPSPDRYYNQSAGSEDRKRTRKLEDYVRGVYGHSASGREQLRGGGDSKEHYTVLLGVFRNRNLEQVYTLAHLYWFKGNELQKRYYTAPVSLNILTHFLFQGDIRAFNSKITKSVQARSYDAFSEFAQDFQSKLGMRQPERSNSPTGRTKPLHLLAKTAGIKVLGNLDAFIREHMLDEANMDQYFDQLKKEYADIAETQQTLDKATEQERMLMPILAKNTDWITAIDDLQRFETLLSILGPWFAQQHVQLLDAHVDTLKQRQSQAEIELENLDVQLEKLRDDDREIGAKIQNNDQGRRLKELENDKKNAEAKLQDRRKIADRYASLARALELQPEPDAALFFAQQAQLGENAKDYIAQKDKQNKLRDDLVGEKHARTQQADHLEEELTSLRKRRNNLPAELINMRTRLSQGAQIPENELPFVGELVQVRASERDTWEQALEKLLTPFSLYLLVPPRHLRQVVKWVRSNDLRVLLRFIEADDQAGEALSNDESSRLAANKLEVQPQSAFANWLRGELNARYPHYCTEDNAEYERKPKALTPEGLYKNGKQHQKDDRKQRFSTVLGWDNADKIRRLETELRTQQHERAQIADRILPIENNIQALDQKITELGRLKDIADFSSIDVRSVEVDIQELIVQMEALRKASSELDVLKEQENKVKAAIKTTSAKRDGVLQQQENIRSDVRKFEAERILKRTDAAQFDEQHPTYSTLAQYFADVPALQLDTIAAIERGHRSEVQKQIDQLKDKKAELKNALERLMQAFKNPSKAILDQYPAWPNDTDGLGDPHIDNIGDYTALLERIQTDQLPELRERYRARASQDIGNAMQVFQQQLEEQLLDHKDNILNINRSLRALPYTRNTYLQVVMEEGTKKGRIGEFFHHLHHWDYDRAAFQMASPAEQFEIWRETVQKIGALIKRLEDHPDWRKEVTDVRNWLNFKTQQVYQIDDTPVSGSLQDSTSGKSGGEQAKLTYTVLAAALTYQFNISADNRNARSFRFIVVDEAFSKLDPENSAYLLNLLGNLHFQMLIITPNTSIKIGEKQMSHLIYVQKESEMPPRSVVHVYSVKELMQTPLK